VEVAAIVTSVALHVGTFVEDIMTQYAQARPWILIAEGDGNTYVSSAMPQKRNPGIMNNTRRDASTAIMLAMGPVLRGHNIPIGMADAKETRPNSEMVRSAVSILADTDRIIRSLVIDPARALEELNSDWTASQELADLLMRKYKLPFRVGHHFASEVVDHAKAHGIRPLDFPYAEARAIYRKAVADHRPGDELPMSEAEFRSALDPVAIVRNRATHGGPQPAEMVRMVAFARQQIDEQRAWAKGRRDRIDTALARLDADFAKLVAGQK
jgi:argininosuccinate lyase